MMSLGELQISFPFFFVPKILLLSPLILSNFDSEKVDPVEVFYYEDIFHFCRRVAFFVAPPSLKS